MSRVLQWSSIWVHMCNRHCSAETFWLRGLGHGIQKVPVGPSPSLRSACYCCDHLELMRSICLSDKAMVVGYYQLTPIGLIRSHCSVGQQCLLSSTMETSEDYIDLIPCAQLFTPHPVPGSIWPFSSLYGLLFSK